MSKKYLPLIPILFLFFTLLSLWLFPIATPTLGIASLLFSLAIAIYTIFERHKESENAKRKITKDTLVLILTIFLVAFLGGVAGLFANGYASPRFGVVVGLISAIAISFVIGYFVKKGMVKAIG